MLEGLPRHRVPQRQGKFIVEGVMYLQVWVVIPGGGMLWGFKMLYITVLFLSSLFLLLSHEWVLKTVNQWTWGQSVCGLVVLVAVQPSQRMQHGR